MVLSGDPLLLIPDPSTIFIQESGKCLVANIPHHLPCQGARVIDDKKMHSPYESAAGLVGSMHATISEKTGDG